MHITAKKQHCYDVKGKKLLFIGASGHVGAAIEQANEMGIETVAINYSPRAFGKRLAAYSAEVDTYVPEEVLKFAKENKIDGLFTGWNEVNIFTAEWVAKELGLPFYGTKKQCDRLVTKDQFKKTCREFGVPVVPEYFCGDNLSMDQIGQFEYPVIFKPVDSGGTRGMTILYEYNTVAVEEAYKKAIDASLEKKVIVEKYLPDTKLIVMDFAVQNGEPYLVSVADRITVRESEDKVPLGFCFMYPSQYIDIVEQQALETLKNLIRGLGIQNAIISFEGMISGNTLYVIETQFRYGGTHMDRFVFSDTGVNLMQMSIEYALTGHFDSWDLSQYAQPRFQRTYSCVNLQMKPGTISSVSGIETVKAMSGVDWFLQLKDLGDVAPDDGSTARNFAKIGLSGSNRKELYRLIDQIQHSLVIQDENGNNMVIRNVPKNLIGES